MELHLERSQRRTMTVSRPSFSGSLRISYALLFLAVCVSPLACVKRPRAENSVSKSSDQAVAPSQTNQTKANDQQSAASPLTNSAGSNQINRERVNINTASAKELEKLPG